MPPGGPEYTLVGFSDQLDWRPLHFVKPIPANRICSACGIVRRTTALLPCMHVLCECCYEQCAQDGGRVCPLDGHRCQGGDVDWKESAVEEILGRKVSCWNEENGCKAVMAASDISLHFRRQCAHHSARCPKCSATVLCRDMCGHLKADCRALTTPRTSECQEQASCNEETALLSSFRRALDEQTLEMRAFLEQLPFDRSSSDDRLNEMYHSMNAFKETLRQELAQGMDTIREALKEEFTETKQIQRSLTTSARQIAASNEEMKHSLMTRRDAVRELPCRTDTPLETDTLKSTLLNAVKQNSYTLSQIANTISVFKAESKVIGEKTLNSVERVLRHAELDVAHTCFIVNGVRSWRDTAIKQGYSDYDSEQVYLRGYCMSPGLRFQKEGDSVTLHVCFRLHKGDMDDVIQWPFEHKVKLTVVHPEGSAQCELEVKPYPSVEYFQRPGKRSNSRVYFIAPSLKLRDLMRGGYVQDDQLRLKWELLA
ncbi:TNF receptor-associated factor 6-like [Amblyomma americanum]